MFHACIGHTRVAGARQHMRVAGTRHVYECIGYACSGHTARVLTYVPASAREVWMMVPSEVEIEVGSN